MTAVAPAGPAKRVKVTPADVAKFAAMKSRVTDFYSSSAHKIAARETQMTAAVIFAEMQWLVSELERTVGPPTGDDEYALTKIRSTVDRVCDEQAAAIKAGNFIKCSAGVWIKYRKLVRWVDAAYRRVLDMDEVAGLGDTIPDEHKLRVTLDLEDDLPDDGE